MQQFDENNIEIGVAVQPENITFKHLQQQQKTVHFGVLKAC